MKRRDFIAGVAAIATTVGVGSSAVVQEAFLERLKRLGCTVTHRSRWNERLGRNRYSVELYQPSSGRGCFTWADSYEEAIQELENCTGNHFEGGGVQVQFYNKHLTH